MADTVGQTAVKHAEGSPLINTATTNGASGLGARGRDKVRRAGFVG